MGGLKRRAQPSTESALPGDLGPALLIERGEREAQHIAVGTRAEGKRARVADPLNRIGLGDPIETLRRKHAAERLRDIHGAARGAKGDQPEAVDRTRDPMALLPAERHLAAKAAERAAWQAIGPTYSGVVQWVVIGWGTLDGYAETKRMRRATAIAWLLAGLDRIP